MKRLSKKRVYCTRLLCLLLTAWLVFSAAPSVLPSYAAEIIDNGTCGVDGDNLTWTIDAEGVLTISGTGDMSAFSQVTPAYNTRTNAPWGGSDENAERIKKVVISDGVTSIGALAFMGCTQIINVTIGKDVTSIGEDAFWNNNSLTEIIIPDSVTQIDDHAFEYCSSLRNITMSANLTRMGSMVFDDTLWYNAQPDGVVYLDNIALGYKGVIPDDRPVTINNGTKVIADNAFSYCTDMTEVLLPDSITWIGRGSFSNCSGLMEIIIPGSVTTIGAFAFRKCTGLTEIIIPDSVTTIEDFAFLDCTSLVSVSIGKNATNIEFANFCAFSGCMELTELLVDSKNPRYSSVGNCIIEKESHTLVLGCQSSVIPSDGSVTAIGQCAFMNYTEMSSINIPDCVNSIGNYAFYGCSKLANVVLPSALTYLGWYSFAYTNITEIEITDGVSQINGGTFAGCVNLQSVLIPDSVTSFTGADAHGGAFGGCTSLASVDLPVSLTSIAWNTFYGCTGLTSIHIPSDVTSIENNAFANCDNLYDVYYDGTEEEWNEIEIAELGNDCLLNATIHYSKSSFSVKYDANGGTGTPSAQTKTQGTALTLSSIQPTKSFIVYYNANGGSVSPASKSVSCTFNNWNTAQNGSGASYAPGASYTADADVTLYAQWTNPIAGTLATPTRSGYTFDGWYTSASGGNKVESTSVISANCTLYAHWSASDIYNLGEESYSFENYGDSDSPGGHCFGMSITSAAYYLNLLNYSRIGGNANSKLYSFSATSTVKAPICYYQRIQGTYSSRSIVAGGSSYLYGISDIETDWNEVVDYVKNHTYDNTGALQIGFRKDFEGGHAINFLRYEKVNGQDRIYAYDNNFPTTETYFYQDSYGDVYQAPVSTFSGSIDCIALRDVATYFSIAGDYNASRVIYCDKENVYVRGLTAYSMEGTIDGKEYVMYEIPDNQQRVVLIPLVDNADFIYKDTEYSFGAVNDDTYGVFTLSSMDEGASGSSVDFKIYNGIDNTILSNNVTLSWTSKAYNNTVQKPTVTVKGSTGNVITEGKSYTVTYSADSKAPGSYTVTVTGMGNYTGTVTKTYTITKQPLVASNVTLSWTSKPYNGSVQKPTVTVKSTHGTTISEGGSYTLTWSGDCKAAGTYTVTITGAGKFTGTVKKTFTITSAAKTISASDVTLSWTSKAYNGAVQQPAVTVKGSTGNVITEGKSYTVTYSADSKAPGSYTVTVKGMGNYAGTVKKTYTITKQPLVASNITLSWTSKAYNGSVQKPTVTVKSSHGTTISEGSSYTLVWSGDCKAAGTYTVTVTGAGKFTGTVKKTFTIASGSKHTIAASDVTLNWTSKAYNGAVQQPAVTVKGSTGNVITEGKSYTVTYSADSKAPGSYTVTVKGMGNYAGTVKKTYTITKQALVAANITLSWTTKPYNGSVQKPTVTVKSSHGTTISEGSSYTLSWSGDCKAAGNYTVTITGAGKFTGTVKKTFTIASGSKHTIAASDVTLSWTSTVYNNTVQKPTVTVKGATGNVITEGKSYTVSYSDENKNAGSYTVTVTGMGSYEGTVTKTYTITKQELDASRVTLSKTSFTYNGSVQQPKVTVKSAADNILTAGGSYTVSYSGNCKDKGTYTITVTGQNNYTGTVTKTFTIK